MEATDVGCGEVVRCAEGAVSSRSRGMGRGGWGAHIEAEDDGVDGGVVAVKDILPARVRRVRDLGERHAHVRSQRHRRLSGRVRRNRHLRRHPGVAVLDETLGLCVVHVDLAAARQERRACRHLLGDARSLLARNLLLLRRHSFGVRARGRCVKKIAQARTTEERARRVRHGGGERCGDARACSRAINGAGASCPAAQDTSSPPPQKTACRPCERRAVWVWGAGGRRYAGVCGWYA